MQALPIVQRGFNYSQDGPGNRLVYHLRGCNMRCPWCSNPDAMVPAGDFPGDQKLRPDEILEQALSARRIMVDGGGVTFSGGEPTLQGEALLEALRLLRRSGIHTAIETNGTGTVLPELLPWLSLLIIDLKHYHSERHRQATGLPNVQVIRNLRTAGRFGLPVWVRTPLIGGFNTDTADIPGFLALYATLDTRRLSFELLPYHEFGRDKWAKCGWDYTVRDGFVADETVAAFEQAYRQAGLRVIRT